jgi:hypothetical protein
MFHGIVSRPQCSLLLLLSVTLLQALPSASAQTPHLPSPESSPPTVIVVAFTGGFVRRNDMRHPEVQMVNRLSEENIPGVHAIIYENRHRGKVLKLILHWLETDGDGHLSAEEKQNARIILLGHSWGGSATIKLARALNRDGIPVLMTIQVDSVNKISGEDCLIPPNVREALNFYQTRGPLHSCSNIRATDPSRTRILGNNRYEYQSQPADCRSYSWLNRHVFKTHEAMDCDPRIWSQIDQRVRAQITIARAGDAN